MLQQSLQVVSQRRFHYTTGCFVLLLQALAGVAMGAEPNASGKPLAKMEAPASGRAITWGTYERPFAADSLWNSRPVKPVFGDFVIQKSTYAPAVAEGPWSSGVFLAKPGDPPMQIRGRGGKQGVWDPDAEDEREVIVPHWPADLKPAAESDGHADIVDPTAGVVHSFWQLKKVDGQWTAALHAWSRLDGRGWGDPAHYYQGARAAGVPTAGGLIRKHELDDGAESFQHVLAVSLTEASLSAEPTYVFPATSADRDGAARNKGEIPEGALLMLPPNFDVNQLTTPILRKVATTLKTFGARVVDRNDGTPFNIYVELGSGFSLHKTGWNNPAVVDLDAIRGSLRRVLSTEGWVDGSGRSFTPQQNLNLLSMRGPWQLQSGASPGRFESMRQAVVFEASPEQTVQVNESGNGLNPVRWALPSVGKTYRVVASTTGGGRLRVVMRDKNDKRTIFDSGNLVDGDSKTFVWPANSAFVAYAISGQGQGSSVGGSITAVSSDKP